MTGFLRARLGWLGCLALAGLLVACDDESGSFCPTVGTSGPALESGDWLLVAHGLSEDWLAASLGDTLAAAAGHGLTGRAPNDLDVAGGRLYVVNSGDNSISAVDLATGRTIGCIALGPNTNPWELVIDPEDPTRAWVTTFLSGEVLEVSLTALRVLRRTTVAPTLEGLWVSDTRIAVTVTGFDLGTFTYGQGYVVLLDKDTLAEVRRLPVPTNPQFLLAGADGRVHAICTGDFNPASAPGRVVRLESDGSAVRDTLTLGGTPARGVVADDGTAYVAGYLGGVMAYDSAAFTVLRDAGDPVVAGVGFTALAVTGDRLFAANFDADAVTAIALPAGTVDAVLPVSDGPVALGVYSAP